MEFAVEHGIAEERILLDPGIGFGKTVAHNLELLRRLRRDRATRSAGRDRHQPQVVPGHDRRRPSDRRPAGGHDRHQRDRLRARRLGVPGARRRGGWRCAARGCCYGACAMAQDDDEFDDADDVDDEDPEGAEPEVTIEVSGLSLYTHVGVTAAEREVGQRLLIDLRIDVGECDATITDRIEDTVDYGQVCEVANLVAQQRNYKTLERLCTAIADRILSQWDVSGDLGQGRQARAAAGAAGHRGVGRDLARGRPGLRRLAVTRTGYLGLGSNIGDRRAHLESAVAELGGTASRWSRPRRCTRPSRSDWCSTSGRSSTPACASDTSHEPEQLLDACKAVERELGRAAGGPRHGPRVIDVDLLLLGDVRVRIGATDAAACRGQLPAVRARPAARARAPNWRCRRASG